MELTLEEFIENNREELRQAITRACPNLREELFFDDETFEEWILNDEGLYNWARSEGVDI